MLQPQDMFTAKAGDEPPESEGDGDAEGQLMLPGPQGLPGPGDGETDSAIEMTSSAEAWYMVHFEGEEKPEPWCGECRDKELEDAAGEITDASELICANCSKVRA